MKLYDQHLHSRHSFDSQADPEANVQTAIERKLAGLTFTEHYDTHPDEAPNCVFDEDRYDATIRTLREKFGRDIRVGKGVEIDYQADNMPRLVEFVERNRFDAVLLSVHWSEGRPIHIREVWDGRDPSDVTRRYLVSVCSAVRHVAKLHSGGKKYFHILGHLDFCKRYSDRFAGSMHVDEHLDVIDDILTACLEADLIPEVNTSTLRNNLPEPMPGPKVMARYAALGGTMMSLGSDSHRSKQVGAGFDRAVTMLRDAGIANVAVFESGKVRPLPIGDGAVG